MTSELAEAFSIREAIKISWQKVKKHFLLLIAASLVMCSVFWFLGAVAIKLAGTWPMAWGLNLPSLILIIAAVVMYGLYLGLIRLSLNIYDGTGKHFGTIFSCFPLLFGFLVASFITECAVTVGFYLLIVPGIILAIKLQFFDFFIVDKKAGPIEALKASWSITTGVKWKLFLLYVALYGICWGVIAVPAICTIAVFQLLKHIVQPSIWIAPLVILWLLGFVFNLIGTPLFLIARAHVFRRLQD